MQVARWGDGLAVRLPDDVVEKLALKEGDEVDIRAAEACTLDLVPRTDMTAAIEKLLANRLRVMNPFIDS